MKHMLKASKVVVLLIAVLCCATRTEAQTILSGNISGTWTPSGNPYIIVDDATVQSGQSLTLEPGVIVWIADGVSMTVNGGIEAVGTVGQHITFQAPIESQFWNSFSVNNSTVNAFSYCDFSNATNALAFANAGTVSSNEVNYCTFSNVTGTALSFTNQSSNQVSFCSFQGVNNGIAMSVNGNNWTLNAKISNCSFTNCAVLAISGVGNGVSFHNGTIVVTIENCVFSSVGNGCSFSIYGGNYYDEYYGYGYGNVQLMNNLFNNVTNMSISLTQSAYAGSGLAAVMNNVIVNAGTGLSMQDPWNATVQSCVFKNCSNAVVDTGSLSRTISYNDFFQNGVNFTGYSSAVYGPVILANRNGTPCDLLYNIYQDPQFISASNLQLQSASPCIDAGVPTPAYFDSCFLLSLGSVTNDIGAYGGPNACQWIYSAPTASNIFSLAIAPYVGVTINPPSAGHYELEYESKLAGTNNWIQITNLDLSAPFLYTEPASSPAKYYRAEKLY